MAAHAVLALERADRIVDPDLARRDGAAAEPGRGLRELLGVDVPVGSHLEAPPEPQQLGENRVRVPAAPQLAGLRPRVRVQQVVALRPPSRLQRQSPEPQPDGIGLAIWKALRACSRQACRRLVDADDEVVGVSLRQPPRALARTATGIEYQRSRPVAEFRLQRPEGLHSGRVKAAPPRLGRVPRQHAGQPRVGRGLTTPHRA